MTSRTATLDYRTTGAKSAESQVVSLAQALERQEKAAARLAPALQQTTAHGGAMGAIFQSATAKITPSTNAIGPLGAGLGAISRLAPQAGLGMVQMAAGTERAALMQRLLNTTILAGAGLAATAAVTIGAYADDVIRAGDTYSTLHARIKTYTDGAVQTAQVERQLYENARNARSEIDGQVTLYSRLAPAVRDWGKSQQDALRITELTTKALSIQGADVREQQASTIQFSQAIASGVLRGDEFRSLREAAPQLLRYVAQNIEINGKVGVAFSQLKGLADKGALTTDKIIDALLKAGPAIEKDFINAPKTAQQGWLILKDKITQTVGQIAVATGAQMGLFEWLAHLTDQAEAFRKQMLLDPSSLSGFKGAADFIAGLVSDIGSLGSVAVDHFDDIVLAGQAIIALKLGEVMAGWFAQAAVASKKAVTTLATFRSEAAFAAGIAANPAAGRAASSLRGEADALAIRATELRAQAEQRAAAAIAARSAAEAAALEVERARTHEMEAMSIAETRAEAINQQQIALLNSQNAANASRGLASAGVGNTARRLAIQAEQDALEALAAAQARVATTDIALGQAKAATAARIKAEAELTTLDAVAKRAEAGASKATSAAETVEAAAHARNTIAVEAETIVTAELTTAQIAGNVAKTAAIGLYNLLGGAIGIVTLALGALIFAVWKAREAHDAEIAAMRDKLVISDQLRSITEAMTAATWAEIPALQQRAAQLWAEAAAAQAAAEANLRLAEARRQKLKEQQGNPLLAPTTPEGALGLALQQSQADQDVSEAQGLVNAARADAFKRQLELDRQALVAKTVEASTIQRQLAGGKDLAGRPLSEAAKKALEDRRAELFKEGQDATDLWQKTLDAQDAAIAKATDKATKDSYIEGRRLQGLVFSAATDLVSNADKPGSGAASPPATPKVKKTSVPGQVTSALDDLLRQQFLPKEGLTRFSLSGTEAIDSLTGKVLVARSEDEAAAAAKYVEAIKAIDGATDKQIAKTGQSREALKQAASARLDYALKTSQASQAEDRWADMVAESTGESRAEVKAQAQINDLRDHGAQITDEAAKKYLAYVKLREQAQRAARAVNFDEPLVNEAFNRVTAGVTLPTDARGMVDVEAATLKLTALREKIMAESERRIREETQRQIDQGELTEAEGAKALADRIAANKLAVEAKLLDTIAKLRAQHDQESAARAEAFATKGAEKIEGAFHDIVFGGDWGDIGKRLATDALEAMYQELIGNPLRKIIHDLINAMFQPDPGASEGGAGNILSSIFQAFGGGGGGATGKFSAGSAASNGGSFLSTVFQAGASLFGFKGGGQVVGAGGPTSDSILAAVSNGEIIVNAAATRKHLPLLMAMNDNSLPAFAGGGLIRSVTGSFYPHANDDLPNGFRGLAPGLAGGSPMFGGRGDTHHHWRLDASIYAPFAESAQLRLVAENQRNLVKVLPNMIIETVRKASH